VADLVYRPIVGAAKAVFAGLGLRLDVVGAEHIPLAGGALLAINHTSFLDFALGGLPANRHGRRLVRFMAKDGIFRHPVAGPLMRGMHHIPVDRDAGSAAFRDAVGALRAGELVGIFPEATMSRAFDVKDIKNGAIRIARAAKVPLIPMIRPSKIWMRSRSWSLSFLALAVFAFCSSLRTDSRTLTWTRTVLPVRRSGWIFGLMFFSMVSMAFMGVPMGSGSRRV